ncbi:MAG: hypothetical protein KKB20_05705 [Proteobacteria bacterium]|nr:hypothetical protein [Pseudomonadota bacterium]
MAGPKKHTLGGLFRRFVVGGLTAMIGSWFIAIFRMHVVRDFLDLGGSVNMNFVLEFVSLTLALFGFFTAVSVWSELRDRLRRVDSLGERDW